MYMKVYVLISVDLDASYYDDEPHIYIKVGRSANLSERLNSIKRKSQSVTTLSPVICSDYPLGYDICHLHPQKLHEPYNTTPTSNCKFGSCIYHTEFDERISPFFISKNNESNDLIDFLDNVEQNKELYKKRFLYDYDWSWCDEHAWVDLSLKSIDKYCDYNYDLLPQSDPFSRCNEFSIVVSCDSFQFHLDEQIAINTARKFVMDHWHYRIFLFNGLPSNKNVYVNPVFSNLSEVNDDLYHQIGQYIDGEFSKYNVPFSHSKEINACVATI